MLLIDLTVHNYNEECGCVQNKRYVFSTSVVLDLTVHTAAQSERMWICTNIICFSLPFLL